MAIETSSKERQRNFVPLAKFMKDCVPLIEREYCAEYIVLFGPAARGEVVENGCIDVILVSDAFRDIRLAERNEKVLSKLNFAWSINALCYTLSEFEQAERTSDVVARALKEGIVLPRK